MIATRPVQALKALSPIIVTLLGIVTLVSPVHSRNAASPMLVTLLGIVVFWQPAINVFVAVSIIALQLSRLSYFVLPVSTVMLVRPGQLAYLQPVITQYFASNKSEIWS